jgi:hypothetical protein
LGAEEAQYYEFIAALCARIKAELLQDARKLGLNREEEEALAAKNSSSAFNGI